jgi:hypothetical protein
MKSSERYGISRKGFTELFRVWCLERYIEVLSYAILLA